MKTLKTLTAAVLIVLSFSAFASDRKNEKLKMNFAINTYIDAVSHGKIQGIAQILDNDAKFTVNYGNRTINYDRAHTLESFKLIKNVKQNCVTEYHVIEQNYAQAIFKVVMKYATFSKISLVSIANTSNGWKITNVSTSYLNI